MYIGKTASVLLAAALLTGCSSSDDDGDTINSSEDEAVNELPTGDDNPTETSMPAPGFDPNDAPQAMTRFDGNYLLSCRQDPDDDEIWDVVELSIQSDLITSTLTEYLDSECTQSTVIVESTLSVIYPGGTANTSLGVADFIDLTVESVTFNGTPVPEGGQLFFDLILLDGSTLYFGLETDDLDLESAENRPIEIDTDSPFVRL